MVIFERFGRLVSFAWLIYKTTFLAEENYNFMKPNTIAAANETLAKEMKQLIVDTDLKTLRKRLVKTWLNFNQSCLYKGRIGNRILPYWML